MNLDIKTDNRLRSSYTIIYALVVKPCNNCPFRADVEFYLGLDRATQIANDVILGDQAFHCHKTTEHGYDGEFVYTGAEKPCVGAMSAIAKERGDARASLWVRLGAMIKAIDVDSLDYSVDVDSVEEFIEKLS